MMQAFLDALPHTLETHIANKNALHFLENTTGRDLTMFPNFIILHGSDNIFLEAYFRCYLRRLFPSGTHRCRPCTHPRGSDDGVAYRESDYHSEFEFTHKHLPLLKDLAGAGTCIRTDRLRIILLKNTTPCNRRDKQKVLANLVDKHAVTTRFVLASPSLSRIDPYLSSRAMLVRVTIRHDPAWPLFVLPAFPPAMYNCIGEHLCAPGCTTLEWIMSARGLSYKLYHMNAALDMVCKITLDILAASRDGHVMHQIVEIAAACEHESVVAHREVLVFERFFLLVQRVIRGSLKRGEIFTFGRKTPPRVEECGGLREQDAVVKKKIVWRTKREAV